MGALYPMFSAPPAGRALNTYPVCVDNLFATVRAKSANPSIEREELPSIDSRIFSIGMHRLLSLEESRVGKYLKRNAWHLDDPAHRCRAGTSREGLKEFMTAVNSHVKQTLQTTDVERVQNLIYERNRAKIIPSLPRDYSPCKYGGCQPDTFSDPIRNAILSTEH